MLDAVPEKKASVSVPVAAELDPDHISIEAGSS